jgi:hypothetical protein
MKISKYFNIDPNILIEYIYDDSNLIGEPYNILFNTKTNTKCFISSDELKPPPKGYKATNNDLYNQLFKIDEVQGRYGKVPTTNVPNKVDSRNYSFLQLRNFPTSIPIRYDIIKVHIPIDYTFDDKKGFFIRAYTYDFDHTNIVELSNYFFNITDIEQNYKLMYSSPIQIINEKQWGKYVQVQIPSVTKVSDQRVFGLTQSLTKENTINYNLTNGKGLSKNSPIFFDFYFINSVSTVGGNKFMNLGHRISFVTSQTPEFEKIGVKIEESTQGDFFLIYGTYNGNIAEFENFIDESYYNGNRYYVEFAVETFEKNVKTQTNKFVVKEDFGDEIEFRPILKFTTTTAVIDVTMRLIDSVDGTFIERIASYGLLQGGGARMGAEPNSRLGTGNGSGGAGDISKYSKSSTKINLRKAKKPEVFNIKSTILPNTGDDPFGTKPILILKKLPFSIFSSNFYFIDSNIETVVNRKSFVPNNKSIVYIYPFDNFLDVTLSDDTENYYNINIYEDIKMIIKTDKKDIELEIYKDSSNNDFENGRVVFLVPEGKYQDIKKASLSGFDLFYITGVDENGLQKIIYSSYYLPWDVPVNLQKLSNDFISNDQRIQKINDFVPKQDKTEEVKQKIDNKENKAKGVNTKPIDNVANQEIKNGSGLSGMSLTFRPKWMPVKEAIELGNDKQNFKNFNIKLKDNIKALEILMINYGINEKEKIANKAKTAVDKKSLSKNKTKEIKKEKSQNDIRKDLLIGYFKGINVEPILGLKYYYTYFNTQNPKDPLVKYNKKLIINKEYYENLRQDLLRYIVTGYLGKKNGGVAQNDVEIGEFLPKNKKDKDLIKKNKIYDASPNKISGKPAVNTDPKTNKDSIEAIVSGLKDELTAAKIDIINNKTDLTTLATEYLANKTDSDDSSNTDKTDTIFYPPNTTVDPPKKGKK